MKKVFLSLSIVAVALAGCRSGAKEQSAGEEQQAENVDEFTSADLNTFGLKGHVKSVTETSDINPEMVNVIEFSPEGEATIKSYWGCDGKIGRDSEGRIASIGTVVDEMHDGTYFTIRYADDGQVAAIVTVTPSYYMEFPEEYATFDEHGWPTSMTCEGGEGGYVLRQEFTYSYPEVDEHGNWTLKVGTGTETETEMDEAPTVTDATVQYKRTITYY